jgi:hypothetical protein
MTESEYTIGEMRVQTVPGFGFFYVSAQTTMPELSKAISEGMPKLFTARDEGCVPMRGSVTFIYRGCSPDAPFTLEIGFPCPPGTKPVDGAQVRRVDDFYCASLIYTGALAHLGEAYDALLRSMQQASLTPGNEGRELYLHWEEDGSPNNVTMIQLSIQGNG